MRSKILVGFLLVLVGMPPAVLGNAWRRARQKLAAVPAAREHINQLLHVEYERPSLFGDPLPGNAWDHYEKAARELSSSEDVVELVGGIINSAYPARYPPRSLLIELHEKHRACCDEVFRALRCVRLKRPLTPSGSDLRFLQSFLIASAEAERECGRDAEALRLLSAVLALSGDCRRGAPPALLADELDAERSAAVIWREVLSNHAMSPAELESACRLLDRIEEARPTIHDAIRIQHEFDRARMVSSYPARAGSQSEQPELRHLWSWTFKLCELLDDMDRNYRSLAALQGRSTQEQEKAVEAMEDAIDRELQNDVRKQRPTDALPIRPRDIVVVANGRAIRELVRVATAVAWVEAERGRMPKRLADLVPRYLPCEIPVPYATGVLSTPEDLWSGFSREAGDVDWPIRRR